MDRLLEVAAIHRDDTATALVGAVVRALHDAAHIDDVCVLAARVSPRRSEREAGRAEPDLVPGARPRCRRSHEQTPSTRELVAGVAGRRSEPAAVARCEPWRCSARDGVGGEDQQPAQIARAARASPRRPAAWAGPPGRGLDARLPRPDARSAQRLTCFEPLAGGGEAGRCAPAACGVAAARSGRQRAGRTARCSSSVPVCGLTPLASPRRSAA